MICFLSLTLNYLFSMQAATPADLIKLSFIELFNELWFNISDKLNGGGAFLEYVIQKTGFSRETIMHLAIETGLFYRAEFIYCTLHSMWSY